MRSVLDINALVAKLDLVLPMNELLRTLSAEAQAWSQDMGLPLPANFDKACRLAIRARRGNPVPPPEVHLAAPKPARKPGTRKKRAPSSKPQTPRPPQTTLKRPPKVVECVDFLVDLQRDVLAERMGHRELTVMTNLVRELKDICGLNGHGRPFGRRSSLIVRGLIDVSTFIASGRARPEQIEETKRILELS